MKTYYKPSEAINDAKETLYNYGYVVKTERWQGIESPDDMWEKMNHSFQMFIPHTIDELKNEVRPNLPWADEHFEERVSGIAYNPPPSHVRWPFAQKDNKQFKELGEFSHTYPERIWPNSHNSLNPKEDKKINYHYISDPIGEEKSNIHTGIRFRYGDFNDVIDQLQREPFTRQAFLPIWFPEDTGAHHGERVPCTIGYHFMRRGDHLHVTYLIRSCDIIRHFRDDIYMASRKVIWLIEQLNKRDHEVWKDVTPGYLAMHVVSLHCFNKEKDILKLDSI